MFILLSLAWKLLDDIRISFDFSPPTVTFTLSLLRLKNLPVIVKTVPPARLPSLGSTLTTSVRREKKNKYICWQLAVTDRNISILKHAVIKTKASFQ